MDDQTPSNDPLDDRLRATFTAERDDLDRRHLANGGAALGRRRSLKWIPFAIAAAALAIAGFFFIGNRSNDQAVEVDVATQTVDGSAQPVSYVTGQNMCGTSYNRGSRAVVGDGSDGAAALAEPEISGQEGVTRILEPGTPVELAGGCTRTQSATGRTQTWYEIKGAPGTPNEWVLNEDLVWQAQPEPLHEPTVNACDTDVPDVPHFVWDVLVLDPDGGLVAHTSAGVDEPITRIIGFDEVVSPTGGCDIAANGAVWYELSGPERSADWVNARYLRAPEPACLQAEQSGTRARNGQHIHEITIGGHLSSLAAQYGIDVEELLSANPHIDPNVTVAGDLIWIPGLPEPREPINGSFDGWGVTDRDLVAFSFDNTTYRWYPTEGVKVGTQCSRLSGGGDTLDTLDALPCLRVAAPVTSSSSDPLEYIRWPAGVISSTADHVHDIRTESNETCTRVVVTFGDNANEEGLDAPSTTLPPIVVNQGLDFVRISPNGWSLESAFMDADRVDYPEGIALLALYPGYEFAVELMHREMEPNVRFFDNPARVVIDLFPLESSNPTTIGPFGNTFVLRRPIQLDPNGPGIPVDDEIEISGFGRPFEAAGLYRIWAVADDVDAHTFLADPPAPLIEEFFPTAGWAEGWGSFLIALPDLEPGTYIAVFGELPPTDEIGFYGTGQLFRVTDSSADEPDTWPEAVLLPNVQLPPE